MKMYVPERGGTTPTVGLLGVISASSTSHYLVIEQQQKQLCELELGPRTRLSKAGEEAAAAGAAPDLFLFFDLCPHYTHTA
jgi:hypothetical protein